MSAAQSERGADRHRDRDPDQNDRVDHGAEDLDATEAEGLTVGRRARRNGGGDQGDDQPDEITQQVAGVGEEGKRAA